MGRLAEGMDSRDITTQKDCVESDLSTSKPRIFAVFVFYQVDRVVLDVQFMKLPGWSCAASNFIITAHTAEYPA
eukprot:1161397-Pelagomonas_calceolata.AAC.5